jgi:hypothetical protein
MGIYGAVLSDAPTVLQRAYSSKSQNPNFGPFDLDLPLTGPEGIESRGLGQDTIYLVFSNSLVSAGSVTTSCGKASVEIESQFGSNLIVTVGAAKCDASNITITVDGVTDIRGQTTSASLTYGKLIGDVDASGVVDALDIQAIRAAARAPVDSLNFRDDLNIDGTVGAKDVMIARSHLGEKLP